MNGWAETFRNWGTTVTERSAHFPCDDELPEHNDAYFRGVTVEASASVVFRWLCQLRVAPYSYDWIDNFGQQSARQLTPGLDELALGLRVMRIFDLVAFERDRHLTLRLRRPGIFPPLACSYVMVPVTQHQCRLLVKLAIQNRPGFASRAAANVLLVGDWIMMRRQLLNLKMLAEASYQERAR